MKNLTLRPLPAVIGISVFTFLVLVAVLVSARMQKVSSQEPKNKTLREMAAAGDVEMELREGPSTREYSDLRELAKDSDAIVMGTIVDEKAYFSDDNDITTVYELNVNQVLKDGRSQAAEISQALKRHPPSALAPTVSFARFGGTVRVNGHRASKTLKGSGSIISGETYIIFLQWTGRQYHLAGGMSGAILVSNPVRVKPLGSHRKLQSKYADFTLETLVQEITSTQPE